MNPSQKEQLFSNPAATMQGVPERIQIRQLVHFYKADPEYGNGVAKKLGLDIQMWSSWVKNNIERTDRKDNRRELRKLNLKSNLMKGEKNERQCKGH